MSFAKLLSPLKAEHFELKDARLHQYAGDKPGSLEGEVYYDPTLHVPKVALDASHSVLLTEPTAPPATLAVGETPSAGVSLKGMRSDAKFGLPGLATGAAHGFMSSTDKAKLDGATTTPTADALSKYDANGRLIVADAVSGQQAVNWQTMVAQITLAQQGLAEKDPCRGLFTSLPANTYNSGTKRITASANGALAATPDGVGSWQVNDRIFFAGTIGTGSAQAGPYRIVQVGSASLPFILERTVDFGGPGAPAGQRLIGALIQVLEGSEHGDSFWVCTNDSITLDTTVLVFRKQTAADVDNSTIELDSAGNLRVKDSGVTYAKMQNGGSLSVLGRSANSSGVLADISATADGQVLRRSGTTLGFGTVANAGLANMAESTIKGRASGAGTGVPTDLSASQVRSILNVADGANAYAHPDHSGDVVSVADGATTIQSNVVTNAKLADVATATIKGRVSAGTGDPEDLTPSQARSVIGAVASSDLFDGSVLTATIGNNAANVNYWTKLATISLGNGYYYAGGIVALSAMYSTHHALIASWNVATATTTGISTCSVRVLSCTGLDPAKIVAVVTKTWAVDGANEVELWFQVPSGNTFYGVRHLMSEIPGPSVSFTPYAGFAWVAAPSAGTQYAGAYNILADNIKAKGQAGSGDRFVVAGPDGTQSATIALTSINPEAMKFRATIGNGSATSFTLAHGLGTADLMCQFIEIATGAPVGIEHYVDTTNIVVQPGVVLPTNSLRVLAWKV